MVDSRLTKMAKVLVNYSLKLKKGDKFAINSATVCEPLMKEVYKEALRVGAYPVMVAFFEDVKEILYKEATDEQLSYVNPVEEMLVQEMNGLLTIWGEENTKAFSNIDPSRQAIYSKARRENTKIYMERMGNGSLKWCGTQFPTNAAAMDAEMSLSEYEEFVFDACKLNTEDPVAEWKKVHDEQQRLVDYLNTKSTIEVKSKDTHLTLSVKGREWENCDGRLNFPDGEVFTSPVEESINGHIRYTYPAVYQGREVEDVELTFENGKVVKATAKKGEEFLREILAIDEGASMVGEFAIGTNYNIQKFTKNILFDEKIGGTIHIAVGSGMPELGGKNVSSIHWDMICDMKDGGEIYADGELFYKDGKFLI